MEQAVLSGRAFVVLTWGIWAVSIFRLLLSGVLVLRTRRRTMEMVGFVFMGYQGIAIAKVES